MVAIYVAYKSTGLRQKGQMIQIMIFNTNDQISIYNPTSS